MIALRCQEDGGFSFHGLDASGHRFCILTRELLHAREMTCQAKEVIIEEERNLVEERLLKNSGMERVLIIIGLYRRIFLVTDELLISIDLRRRTLRVRAIR